MNSSTGVQNLHDLYMQADGHDHQDGRTAYIKYHGLLQRIALLYGFPFETTAAAFAALSPNNDYLGNLRSLISVLAHGELATVSTYKACAKRALSYLHGQASFVETVKGQKITAFYFNITDPTRADHVTIDGHMVAAYLGQPLTMKEAGKWLTRTRYAEVANAVKQMAYDAHMLPHQMQAILWMTRKRVLGVKYTPQFDLFPVAAGEGQQITYDVRQLKPYPIRRAA